MGARLIAIGLRDHGARIIRDDQSGHAPVEGERARHRLDPILEPLCSGGPRKGVARSAQRRDEHVGVAAIEQRQPRAREVNEQLLAGAPVLAHRALEPGAEGLVVLAELRIAPGTRLGMLGDVLLPQQQQGDALAAELLVNAAPIGFHVGREARRARQQPSKQRSLIPRAHRLPIQPGGRGQSDVLRDDTLGYRQGGGNLLVRELTLPLQANDVLDHA